MAFLNIAKQFCFDYKFCLRCFGKYLCFAWLLYLACAYVCLCFVYVLLCRHTASCVCMYFRRARPSTGFAFRVTLSRAYMTKIVIIQPGTK